MKQESVPYRRMIFVCMNASHEGENRTVLPCNQIVGAAPTVEQSTGGRGRPVCAAGGAEKILGCLKDEVKNRGLKGKIRALKSGCMDLCEKGPNVMVFPEGVLHSGVKPEDAPALVEKYLV